MKNFSVLLGLFVFIGMLSGCGDTNNTTSTAAPTSLQEVNKTGTLQGTIYDAVTGARIGGSDLMVYLIQGASNRGPDKLNSDPNDPLVGEYAFAGIPVTFSSNTSSGYQNTTYKVVVIKPGYQRFEAEFTFEGKAINPGTVYEAVYNRIGNIYLFPLGATSGDVTIYVYNPQGLPIPNATVYLNQNTNNNVTQVNSDTLPGTGSNTITTTDRLYDTTGLIASLTAPTDTAGKATFASATLTLGGQYVAVVPGLPFQGEQLATSSSAAINIGTDAQTRTIYMTLIGNSLYAVSASNQVPGTIDAAGVLTVTFSQPIILSTTTFGVTINNGGVLALGTVTGVLSNGGTTLTLTPPSITTAPSPSTGVFITYTYGGTITLMNSQAATAFTLFGGGNPVQNITTSAAVSGAVQTSSF